MSILWGMKMVPPRWFAACWTKEGRPVKVVATSPSLKEVLEVMEKNKFDPEVKVFRHGFRGLRRWILPGDGYPISELVK